VHDLRDKTILDFKTPQITKIEFIRNGKTLSLKKNEESWEVSEGKIAAKGNETEITNLLNTIQAAQIEQFVEEKPEQLTSYGLNNSKLTVKLTTSKASEPLALLIGGGNEHGFYAKALPKKNVFTINQSFFDTLNNRKLVDFFNKSLVDFNDDDLAKVALLMDGGSVDLIRDEKDLQKWTMVKPVNMKANTATINSLLFDLKNVRIVEFITTHTKNSKKFNFEQPEKEINLTFKNGKTWTLKLGNQTSSPDHYFAQRSDDETVFTLQKSSAESIFRSLYDLKDRTVLKFDDDLVREIQIHDSKQTLTLKKSIDKWKLISPKPSDSIQSFIGKDILWTLNSIEFESVLARDPGNTVTGLTNPKVSIKLLDEKSTIITHLLIGNPVAELPEVHYLKLAEHPNIYTMKNRSVDEILSNLKKLKEKL
jgi:hypothetical protein